MNTCIIMGRVVRDPELKKSGNGIPFTTISVAVDREGGKEGEEKKVDFFDVVAFRKTAEFICAYFMKGKPILIQGRLQQRKYVAKDGTNRSVVEIMADRVDFCGGERKEAKPAQAESFTELPDIGDSDLPFDMGGDVDELPL